MHSYTKEELQKKPAPELQVLFRKAAEVAANAANPPTEIAAAITTMENIVLVGKSRAKTMQPQ